MMKPGEIEMLREILGDALTRKLCPVDLIDWIDERYENAKRIAGTKKWEDRQGWLEDAAYFLRCREALKQLAMASGDEHENVPIRMHIALRILRAWHSGTAGFDATVVHGVNRWFDGGMKGPVPWPDSPFFAEWAEQNGYSKIHLPALGLNTPRAYVGFKFQVKTSEERGR